LDKREIEVENNKLETDSPPEHHLAYEIYMFFKTAGVIFSIQFGCSSNIDENNFVLNALLESFLVHARNLMDFLWKKNFKGDDITCKDFFSQNCNSIRSGKDVVLMGMSIKGLKDMINKQISHLTSSRSKEPEEKTKWYVLKMACDMRKYLDKFIKKADKFDTYYKGKIKDIMEGFQEVFCKNESVEKFSTSVSTTFVISSIFDNPVNKVNTSNVAGDPKGYGMAIENKVYIDNK